MLCLRKVISACFVFVALLFCFLGAGQIARADSYTYTLFNGLGTSGSTYLYGINNSDQLIGVSNGQGFLYSSGVLTALDGEPSAINNNGDVLGFTSDNTGNFLYRNGNVTALPTNGYPFNQVRYTGINDADTVVGTYEAIGGPIGYGQPVMVTYNPYTSTVTTLDLPGTTSNVRAINDAGIAVGNYSISPDSIDHAGLIVSNGSFSVANHAVPTHDFEYTFFTAVNNSGQILGNYNGGYEGSGYFIYSNGVFTDLNLPSGYTATSINDKGQIAGTASLGGGVFDGFIGTPVSQVPEIDASSGASALALLGGVLLILRGGQPKLRRRCNGNNLIEAHKILRG